jgi:glycosyltransferase involved in cell wall biosynthesis
VHEDCDVTRDHVVESGGGLYFRTAADFAGALDRMLGDAPLCRRMAAAGRRYVLDHYAWPEIIRRFKEQVFIPSPPPADQRP